MYNISREISAPKDNTNKLQNCHPETRFWWVGAYLSEKQHWLHIYENFPKELYSPEMTNTQTFKHKHSTDKNSHFDTNELHTTKRRVQNPVLIRAEYNKTRRRQCARRVKPAVYSAEKWNSLMWNGKAGII